MTIGCLGKLIFEVSEKCIKTFRKAELSGSAKIQTHDRHLDKALTEFVGTGADSFSFSMRVSRFLGADPINEIDTIKKYMESGTALTLTIGKRNYGHKWLIQKYKVTFENYDISGNLIDADISITLQEYSRL